MRPSEHQPNIITLPSICVKSHNIVIHEFFHAFGLSHTHQRPDRDDFITVHFNNITPKWKQWYRKKRKSETSDIRGIPYDVRSFMHYKGYSNVVNKNKPSMTSKVFQI